MIQYAYFIPFEDLRMSDLVRFLNKYDIFDVGFSNEYKQ